MPKIRLTPTITGDSGVRETYETKVNIPNDGGLGSALQAVVGIADTYVKVKQADKSTQFAHYKNKLGVIQKQTQMDMALAPDGEKRLKIAQRGESDMKLLAADFEYRKADDVQNFNEIFMAQNSISNNAVYAKLHIEELKTSTQMAVDNIISNGIGPVDERIKESNKLLDAQSGISMNHLEVQAGKKVATNAINTRWITSDTSNQFSDLSMQNTIGQIPMTTTEMRDSGRRLLGVGYEKQREQIKERGFDKAVEDKMLADSEANETRAEKNIDIKYKEVIVVQNTEAMQYTQEYLNTVALGQPADDSLIRSTLDNMNDLKMKATLEAKLIAGTTGAGTKTTDKTIRKALTSIAIQFQAGDMAADEAFAATHKLMTDHGTKMTLEDMNKTQSTLTTIRNGDSESYTQAGKNISLVNNYAKDVGDETGLFIKEGFSKDDIEDKFEDIMDDYDTDKERNIEKMKVLKESREPVVQITTMLNKAVADWTRIHGVQPTELERNDLLQNVVMPVYGRTATRKKVLNDTYTSPTNQR